MSLSGRRRHAESNALRAVANRRRSAEIALIALRRAEVDVAVRNGRGDGSRGATALVFDEEALRWSGRGRAHVLRRCVRNPAVVSRRESEDPRTSSPNTP